MDHFQKCFAILKLYQPRADSSTCNTSEKLEVAEVKDWKAIRVDLVITPLEQYSYALLGWTGSRVSNHNRRFSSHCKHVFVVAGLFRVHGFKKSIPDIHTWHFMLSSTPDHGLELMNSWLTFMDASLGELISIFLEAYCLGLWSGELGFWSVVLSFCIMILLTSNLNGYWVDRWFGKHHIILQEIKHLRKRCSELELNLFCRKLKTIWHLSFWIRSDLLFQLHFNRLF